MVWGLKKSKASLLKRGCYKLETNRNILQSKKMVLINRFFKPTLYLLCLILVISRGLENASAETKNIKVRVSFRPQLNEKLNVKKFKLNHPIQISKREIINHLVSLRYKETSFDKKGVSVFFADEVRKLAPILVKAFARVDSRKIIHIELKSKTGTTEADIFSFKKYLNWRFESIHGETFFQKNNARIYKIFAWELIPQKGQLYYKSSKNKRLHKNWLVAKLNLPVSQTKDSADGDLSDLLESGDSKNKLNQELERKLKHLKHLYEEGLIEEEEYKAQQNKLFEKLF